MTVKEMLNLNRSWKFSNFMWNLFKINSATLANRQEKMIKKLII